MNNTKLGKVAYEGYCQRTGWKSLISGADLPPFEQLPAAIKEAWEAAADQVVGATMVCKATPKAVPDVVVTDGPAG